MSGLAINIYSAGWLIGSELSLRVEVVKNGLTEPLVVPGVGFFRAAIFWPRL